MDLNEKVINKLIEKNISIATMESCTSGSLISALTDVEGASAVVKNLSLVTYSNQAKIEAGVPRSVIEGEGVYSYVTAIEMARKCKERGGADITIGVTGTFNKADPNNDDSRPGEVFFCIDMPKERKAFKIIVPAMRRNLQKAYVVDQILSELITLIE